VEVRALEVEHTPKALLPYGVHLILNRKKSDRQCCCSGEAALTQVSKSNVCHHLDGGVGLTSGDTPQPRLHGTDGDCHADLTHVRAMGHGQPACSVRSECCRCSQYGGVRHIAISETPASAGLWYKVFHPW
jgi:hypothetical protein